jgi:hypothetical protein
MRDIHRHELGIQWDDGNTPTRMKSNTTLDGSRRLSWSCLGSGRVGGGGDGGGKYAKLEIKS